MDKKKLLYVLVPVVLCVVVLGIILLPKGEPEPAEGNEDKVAVLSLRTT